MPAAPSESIRRLAGLDALPAGAAGVCRLDDLGLLRVHGADAQTFLQSQLTQDVRRAAPGGVLLAGYCTPKGRLLATFWIWTDAGDPQTFWLACSRGIAATVARRLAMFVLRAKAKVEDVSAAYALIGAIALDAADRLPAGAARLTPLRIDASSAHGGAAATIGRAIAAVPVDTVDERLADWRRAGLGDWPASLWARLEVLSGIARIGAGSQELFVPQMVNLELADGVSFQKGCYPGQEIVARSQYLGKLKRRMFIGVGDGDPPAPGSDVTAAGADDGAEPIGQVVLSAPAALPGRFLVQFESRIDGVALDGVALDGVAGPDPVAARIGASPVRLLPLPYPIAAPADR